jgi:tetratricopeptide (TPR) repeat protein
VNTRERTYVITAILSAIIALLPVDDVTGVVVDQDENPLGGALVMWVHPTDSEKDVSSRTDAQGRFTVSSADMKSANAQLVALKKRYAVGVHRSQAQPFSTEADPDYSHRIRIQLRSADAPEILLMDPEGKPIAGAVLIPRYMGTGNQYVYRTDGLPRELAPQTGADGRARLNGLSDVIGGAFQIDTPEHGRQTFAYVPSEGYTPDIVELATVGSLSGRIDCEQRDALAGWTISLAAANPGTGAKVQGKVLATGVGTTVSAADGTFQLPVLATGSYSISAVNPNAMQYHVTWGQTVTINTGETTDVAISLKKGRRAFGRVVERKTERPVVGVELHFGEVQAVTDENGRFEGFVKMPPTWLSINRAPDGYVVPPFSNRAIEIKDPDVTEFDLGTFTLKGTEAITGVVTDENREPQQGIAVTAAWVQHDEEGHGTFSFASETVVTDDNGRYRLVKSPDDESLLLTGFGKGMAIREPLTLPVDADRHKNFTVGRDHTVRLAVVVKDSDGKPVASASAKFNRSLETPERGSMGGRQIRFAGKDKIAADDSGVIRTPVRVERQGKYSLAISANGYLPLTTEYIQPAGTEDDALLGEFTLQRARSASGGVYDTVGQPVSGITVSAHGIAEGRYGGQPLVSVQTDADGRFHLSPLHPHSAVVMVRAEGYRATGAAIPATEEEIRVTVFRNDEAVPESDRVTLQRRSNQRTSAGIFLLEEMLPTVRNSNYFHGEALKLLGRVAPDRLPSELAETTNASATVGALISLGEYEEANAQAEQISSGYSRGYARFGIIDACPDAQLAEHMIAAALIDAKTIQRPDRRAVVLAGVAQRLTAIGKHEQAHALLSDSIDQFRQLPPKDWAGYAKGFFAERLARYDFDAAIAMLDDMEPDDKARHAGNIAHALAAIEPDKAEQLMEAADATRSVVAYRIRVCYRMAGVDLKRAEQIRQGHSPDRSNYAKEHSLGVMAMALKKTDPQKAKELLQQAWSELEATADQPNGNSQGGKYRFGVALALLNYAEEIDPQNLTDHFWRAIAMFPGPQTNSWKPSKQAIDDLDRRAMLLLAFGLYDREPELCQRIMEPAFEYWSDPEHLQNHDFYRKTATFTAMALADPKRATQWARDAYKAMPVESRRLIPQPWLTVAKTLCSDRQTIQDMLADEVFIRWIIDNYDQ